MRLFKFSALAAAVALAGCVDVDLTTTITGADSAQVSGYMEIQRQMLDMMGGSEAFCDQAEGGTLTVTDTTARCDMVVNGTFAEVFQGDEPKPTATDQGDGTVLVSFPIGAMTADSAEMRNDPQSAAMMRPMLEGQLADQFEPVADALRVDGYDGVISFESVYHPGNGDFEAGFRQNIAIFKRLFG